MNKKIDAPGFLDDLQDGSGAGREAIATQKVSISAFAMQKHPFGGPFFRASA